MLKILAESLLILAKGAAPTSGPAARPRRA